MLLKISSLKPKLAAANLSEIDNATITTSVINSTDINGGNLQDVIITTSSLNNCTYNNGTAYSLTLVDPIIENTSGDPQEITGANISNSAMSENEWTGGSIADSVLTNASMSSSSLTASTLESSTIESSTISNSTINDCIIGPNLYKQTALIGNGIVPLNINIATVFSVIASGNVTFTFTNFTTGYFQSIMLHATNFGGKTIVFPEGTRFPNGNAISFSPSGTDLLVIVKDSNEIFSVYPVAYNVKTIDPIV